MNDNPLYEESVLHRFIRTNFEALEAGPALWLALLASMALGAIMTAISVVGLGTNGWQPLLAAYAAVGVLAMLPYPLAFVATDWQRDKTRADQSAARQAARQADKAAFMREIAAGRAVIDVNDGTVDSDTRDAANRIIKDALAVSRMDEAQLAAELAQAGMTPLRPAHDSSSLSEEERQAFRDITKAFGQSDS